MVDVTRFRLVSMLVVFSIFITALQLTLPIYSMQVFSRVVPTGHFATLAALFSLMIALNGCGFLIDAARGIIISRWSLRYHCASYAKIACLTLDPCQSNEQPLSDLNTVRIFMSGPIAVAVLDAPWSVIFIVAMFALHRTLGLIAICIFLVVIAWSCVGYYLTRILRRLTLETRVLEQSLITSAHVERQVVQAMGLRATYLRQMRSAHLSATFYFKRLDTRMAWLDAGTRLLRNIFQIVILTTAAILALTREVEVGAIVASTMLFSRALAPIERISSGLSQIAEFRAARGRLKKSAAKVKLANTPLSLPLIQGRVVLDNVGVRVTSKLEPILTNINITIEPGSVVVVVGREGAGKSTFARVVCGALTPDQGEVRLDGFHLGHYDLDQLGPQVGYLPDAVNLESGTVASIIARGGVVDMAAVIEAATSAGAHSMIQKLQAGYDTVVRSGDMSISAGQRQRVALARALYQRPKLVVLDEPTAHLDDEGEMIVANIVQEFRSSGSTMIIVSRLPTLLHLADKLLLLEGGNIRLSVGAEQAFNYQGIRLATDRAAS